MKKFNDRLPFAYNFLRMKIQVKMRVQKQKILNQLKDKTTKKKTNHLKRNIQIKIWMRFLTKGLHVGKQIKKKKKQKLSA